MADEEDTGDPSNLSKFFRSRGLEAERDQAPASECYIADSDSRNGDGLQVLRKSVLYKSPGCELKTSLGGLETSK